MPNGKSTEQHANESAPAYRGRGVADLIVEQDFGLQGAMTFTVDTKIELRNTKAFKTFLTNLESGAYKRNPKIRDEMIALLDKEVAKLGTPPSGQLSAKNMFRAALGAPPIVEAEKAVGGE